jgi:integrase
VRPGRGQARAFLEAVRGDRLEALYKTALLTGLRQGELQGLRWADVDLDAGQVSVSPALQRQEGKLRLVPPKTAGSKRMVPSPDAGSRCCDRIGVDRLGIGCSPVHDGSKSGSCSRLARVRRCRPGMS